MVRYSKDKIVGNGGRNFIEWLQNNGWYILNSTMVTNWKKNLLM